VGAEPGKAERAAIAVSDREHDPRREVRVDASPRRDPGEPRSHHLVGRVAELLQMLQQVSMADRREADSEGPDCLLVDPLCSNRIASPRAGLVLPETGLEELGRIRKQLPDSVLRGGAFLDFFLDSDPVMLPDRPKYGRQRCLGHRRRSPGHLSGVSAGGSPAGIPVAQPAEAGAAGARRPRAARRGLPPGARTG
jgi:hypothetical protein